MNDIIVTELTPTDSRKSFYGKAKLIEDSKAGKTYLMLYSTVIGSFDRKTEKFSRHSDHKSATTSRHVKSFIRTMAGGCSISVSDFWSLPVETRPVLEIEI